MNKPTTDKAILYQELLDLVAVEGAVVRADLKPEALLSDIDIQSADLVMF